MRDITTKILLGDSREVLKTIGNNMVDLIVTSPPYADRRKNTYGGIDPDGYVDWFLPISEQLLRVLKPTGTFMLNIKEKTENGERSIYVLELILALRKQGWLWTEEFIWHKKIVTLASGRIVSAMHGSVYCNSTKPATSICTKKRLWYRLVLGQTGD